MKISAPLLTLGSDPEPTFTDNGLMVKFRAAENHNRNVGTKDNPEWKQVGTSWFNFTAFDDTAEKVLNELEKGDGFRLKAGKHSKKNIGTKEKPNVVNNYIIYEFEKYERQREQQR